MPHPSHSVRWIQTARVRLTLLFGGVSLLIALVLALYLDYEASRRLTRQGGEALVGAGRPIAAALAEGLREREREVALLSHHPLLTQGAFNATELRAHLEEVKLTLPYYSWIGVADPWGVVQNSTGGLLLQQSVAQRPWFSAGLRGPYLGDAHDAVLLDRLLREDPHGEPLRFLDFASPIRSPDSQVRGVIAAHLNWEWARAVIAQADLKAADGLEVLIVNGKGEYLLPFALPSAQHPQGELPGPGTYRTLAWGEQDDFLTAAVPVPSHTTRNLAWTVVVRQPLDIALAPVKDLHRLIVTGALLLTALLMALIYWVARRFSLPLEQLSAAARQLDETGQGGTFDIRANTLEFADLRNSLRGMTQHLLQSQQELREANAELERKVEQRTAEIRLREQQYRGILEDQTEVICRFRGDYTLTYVNEAYCRMFGLRREDVLGQVWAPVVHPDDLDRVRAELAAITPEQPMVQIENRVLTAHGEVRHCAFVNRATFDEQGQVLEWQTVGRDVTESKRLAQEVERVSAEFQDLYDHAPCGYYSVDSQGRFMRINDLALSWLGLPREQVLGQLGPADFFDEAGRSLYAETLARLLAEGRIGPVEFNLIGRQGLMRRVSLSSTAVRDPEGRFVRSRSVMYDVSELFLMRYQLRQLNAEQEAMLDNDLLGIAKVRDRRIVWRNRALERIFGFEQGELLGSETAGLYPSQEVFKTFGAEAYPLLESGQHIRKQMVMRKKNGDPIWIDLNGVRLSNETGESLWLLQDVSEMKQYQAQVEHLAFHDPLTDLPNRLLLADRLRQAMAFDDRLKTLTAVCYLDLDGFKPVNDRHGHEAGDVVLQEIARRLQDTVRGNDTVARLGGDEFALLLTGLAHRDEADLVIRRIVNAVRQPITLPSGAVVQVSTSVGLAFHPLDGQQPAELLMQADQAMYAQKQAAQRPGAAQGLPST